MSRATEPLQRRAETLQRRAEILKLARILEHTPEELAYLEGGPA
jgi:hypothetical protein